MIRVVEIKRCLDCPTLSQGEPRTCATVGRTIEWNDRLSIPDDCTLPTKAQYVKENTKISVDISNPTTTFPWEEKYRPTSLDEIKGTKSERKKRKPKGKSD